MVADGVIVHAHRRAPRIAAVVGEGQHDVRVPEAGVGPGDVDPATVHAVAEIDCGRRKDHAAERPVLVGQGRVSGIVRDGDVLSQPGGAAVQRAVEVDGVLIVRAHDVDLPAGAGQRQRAVAEGRGGVGEDRGGEGEAPVGALHELRPRPEIDDVDGAVERVHPHVRFVDERLRHRHEGAGERGAAVGRAEQPEARLAVAPRQRQHQDVEVAVHVGRHGGVDVAVDLAEVQVPVLPGSPAIPGEPVRHVAPTRHRSEVDPGGDQVLGVERVGRDRCLHLPALPDDVDPNVGARRAGREERERETEDEQAWP